MTRIKRTFLTLVIMAFLGSCVENAQTKHSENDIPLENAFTVTGVYDGVSLKYHSNGVVKKRAIYSKGKLHGKMFEYDTTGTIHSMSNFIDGFREGKMFRYYPNGNLKEAIDYDGGWKNGKRIRYHQNGKISKYSQFIRDEEVYYIDYDTTGNEIFQGRKIVITPESDTISLGKYFRVKVEFFGPYEKPARIGARFSSNPAAHEVLELFEMMNSGPYHIAFAAQEKGKNYITVHLDLDSLYRHVRVVPVYVRQE